MEPLRGQALREQDRGTQDVPPTRRDLSGSRHDVDYSGSNGGPEFYAQVAALVPQVHRWEQILDVHARDHYGLCGQCCGQRGEPVSSPCLQRALALHAKWDYEAQHSTPSRPYGSGGR